MAEPEADPERDQRTVFAYQVIKCIWHMYYFVNFDNLRSDLLSWLTILKICLKANERDVYEFFSKAGKVGIAIFIFLVRSLYNYI